MGFKEWLINEAGHFTMTEPSVIQVIDGGKLLTFKGVKMIDPRFEFMNIPNPELDPKDSKFKLNKGNKFVGQFDFALPLAGSKWIFVKRTDQFSGIGKVLDELSDELPKDVLKVPDGWFKHAQIMDDNYLLNPTYGGNVAI